MNDDNNSENNLLFKIILLGDSQVGKTSIISRYNNDTFTENLMSTIGVLQIDKCLKRPPFDIKLIIMDTAGQERFNSITKNYFNNINGVVYVFDLTVKKSFDNIKNWVNLSKKYGNFYSVICANKCDLHKKRQVTEKDIKSLKMDAPLFETSAKLGTNINEAFDKLIDLIMKDKSNEELLNNYRFSVSDLKLTKTYTSFDTTKGKKGCCGNKK